MRVCEPETKTEKKTSCRFRVCVAKNELNLKKSSLLFFPAGVISVHSAGAIVSQAEMVKTNLTPQAPGKVGYYTVTKEELVSKKAKLEAALNCTLRESAEDKKTLEGSTIKFLDVNGVSIASSIHSLVHGLYRLAVSNFGIQIFPQNCKFSIEWRTRSQLLLQ